MTINGFTFNADDAEMTDHHPQPDTASGASPTDGQPYIPVGRDELLLDVSRLGEARFNLLLGLLQVPTQHLSGIQAAVSGRTAELFHWVEGPGGCGLKHLREALEKLLRSNGELPPDPETAEKLLAQYREKLKKAIGTARFYGLPDRPLEKVFVELTVIEDFEVPRDAEYKALMDKELRRRRTLFPKNETEEDGEIDPEEPDEEGRERPRKVRRTVKPEELLEAGKRSQVVGAPGCGKTTLLRWLALQIAQTSDRLPVLIELRGVDTPLQSFLDFFDFLFKEGILPYFSQNFRSGQPFETLKSIFLEFFNEGLLVILLDGLDEISESKENRPRIALEKFQKHLPSGATLVISTRPYGYLRNFADLKTMEIEPLSDSQIGLFLDHWCEEWIAQNVKASLRKNPNLRGLARFPFLLAFIAHLKSGGDIPRIELYQQIVSELVTKLDKDKGVERFKIDDQSGTLKRGFLRQLSFERLFESRTTDLPQRLVFSFEELVERAEDFLRKKNRNFAPEDLAFDVCATPLLREVQNEQYTFAHLTIQEFLAAEELSKRDDCHKLFIQAFFNRQLAEMEVLPMTIGLAENPNTFYNVLSKTPESFDFIRLCLEARSLGYHQKTVPDAYYQKWQKKLTGFGLEKVKGEAVFSNTVFASFTGIETRHSNQLTSGFLSALCDWNPSVRQRAAEALVQLGNASPDVITALADALRDKEWPVRQSAADALGKLGNASPGVIHALADALRDKARSVVRQSVVRALGKLGNATPNVIRALANALRDENGFVRQRAAQALVQLGNASPDVIRALASALHDKDRSVRLSAAEALVQLGNASPDVIHTLTDALRNEFQYVRLRAAEALGKLGNASPDVIRALSDALRDKDSDVRLSAANALGKLDHTSPDVIRVLTKGLLDKNRYEDQRRTDDALVQLGNATPDIITALADALRDQNFYVRQRAAEALVQLGNASPDVITALADALRDQDLFVRQSAAEALGKLGNASPDVITALADALRDQESWVRQSAAEALGKLGNPSPDVITALADALCDQESWVRQRAAEALERIGFDSSVFLEGLKLMLSSTDPELQKMALRSIGYPSTDPGLLDDLKKLTKSRKPRIREAAEDAYNKYKFKLEMLELLPA